MKHTTANPSPAPLEDRVNAKLTATAAALRGMSTAPAISPHLAAKVAAVNAANRAANQYAPAFLDAARPFVGSQVVKVTGDLMQRFRNALPALPSGPRLQSYLRTGGGYDLTLTFKTHEPIGDASGYHSVTYHETTVYLGTLSNGTLTKLHEQDAPRRTDYTAAEVAALREAAEAAREAARNAENACHPFGLFDR